MDINIQIQISCEETDIKCMKIKYIHNFVRDANNKCFKLKLC